jgi:hypothetical protein
LPIERRATNKVKDYGVIVSIILQVGALVFGAGMISSALNTMSKSLDKHTQQIENLIVDGASVRGDIKTLDVRVDNHEVRITRLEDN